jgi:myo-inositol-hexaphosphate 3-phosphohydrolase
VLSPTGFGDIIDENVLFVAYPNPAKNTIQVTMHTAENATMAIYDAMGKILISKNIKNNENIDIAVLANGMYSLQIVTKNNKAVKYFVKN